MDAIVQKKHLPTKNVFTNVFKQTRKQVARRLGRRSAQVYERSHSRAVRRINGER